MAWSAPGRVTSGFFTRPGIRDASAVPTLLRLDKNPTPIYHGDPVLTYLDSDVMSYEPSLPMPSRGQPADDKTADDKPAEDKPAMSSSSLPMSRLLTTSPLMQAC